MSRKKAGRELSAHEKALWDQIVKRAKPLPRQRATTLQRGDRMPDGITKIKATPAQEIPQSFALGARARKESETRLINPPSTISAGPLNMDKKNFGRMMRGKLRPEARLDLHGLTLADAHPALHRFILSAFSRGFRLVLVITGKGKEKEAIGPIPVRTGALRHQVPIWLRAPSLAHAVLEVSQAHHRHGGAGAYYVYLKRNAK